MWRDMHKPICLITHNDLDGVACAVLGRAAYGEKCKIRICAYEEFPSAVREAIAASPAKILLTDCSPPEDLAEEMDRCGKAFLVDHHVTSLPLKERYGWANVDTSRSAAWLLFDLLDGWERFPAYAEFVRLVNDRDLWLRRDLRSDDLACLLRALGQERFFERFTTNPSVEFTEVERSLIEAEKRRVERACREARVCRFVDREGRRVGAVFAGEYASEIGSAVLEREPDLDYVAVFRLSGPDPGVSLRSRKGGVNVAEVARILGGGGHQAAAGFPLTPEEVMEAARGLLAARGLAVGIVPETGADASLPDHEYRFVNQSYRWGRPGVLHSDVELEFGVPVPGRLVVFDEPDAEEKHFRFTHDPRAETYIVLYRENGNYYSEVAGEPARVYNWNYYHRSGTGFIFFRPGAKVMFHPYNARSRIRVATEKGIFPYTPVQGESVSLEATGKGAAEGEREKAVDALVERAGTRGRPLSL